MFTMMIAIAAGIGVAALIAGVGTMLRRPDAETIEDRLDALAGLTHRSKALANAESSVLAGPLDDMPNKLEQFVVRFFNLRLLMQQANVEISVLKFITICLVLAGVGVATTVASPLQLAFAPVLAVTLGALPIGWLLFQRKRRLGRFAKQLPEALELVSRALCAGHSLAAGLQLVGEEMADPIGEEFTRVFEEQNLGVVLDEALENLTDRVPNLDLKFFATAVVLQRQTGGDLAEILDKIGTLVRERFKIHGAIQALTGEGRLSGIILLSPATRTVRRDVANEPRVLHGVVHG